MLPAEALTPSIRHARPHEMELVRALFRTYLDHIAAPECFPSFEAELASLPGRYAPPGGCILLADISGEVAGIVALRPFQGDVGEVKRLFVLPSFHGRGLGRLLMKALLAEARRAGYQRLLLDTIPGRMDAAISLYRSLGFQETGRYYDDPIPGILYMSLELDQD